MLSGTVWPAHPRPLPGEALSSWFIRCAHANGMKAQTFAVRNFGHQRQLWNRDIDRFAPDWLLQTMSDRTGTPLTQVKKMTALLFEGRLFQSKNLSGQLRWWLPLNMYHRTYRNFGIQYCPQCLAEDAIPYFRLGWRLAFYTFCPKHQIMLHVRCHQCLKPVAFHRVELGNANLLDAGDMNHCWNCNALLSEAPKVPLNKWHNRPFTQWETLLKVVDRQFRDCGPFNKARLILWHQMCRLIVSENLAPDLQRYICSVVRQPMQELVKSRKAFEQRDIRERHYVLGLAAWTSDVQAERKLRTAIQKRILPSNQVYRDLKNEEINQLDTLFFLPPSKRGGK
ncbi:TniQ family protein [Vibrio cholerae]|uniref:TniQ family protein n=1 Tax=Vibrio cholerae TaxID=666 RepID=UPI00226DCCD1|nr:TniQ family protein [Vibrio cholerae]MCX9439958.1 TniQ family protein [Vibrio cholerae]